MDFHHLLAAIIAAAWMIATSLILLRLVRLTRANTDALTTIFDAASDTASRADRAEAAVVRLARHLRETGTPAPEVRRLAYPVDLDAATPPIR